MNNNWNRVKVQTPEEIFTSIINETGYLILPEECFYSMVNESEKDMRFVLTKSLYDGDKRIALYTIENFEPVKKAIHSLNKLSPEARMIERRVVFSAESVQIDSARQIKISSEFLIELGVESDSVTSQVPVDIFKYSNGIEIALKGSI